MKISTVRPILFTHDRRGYLLVKIETDDGRYGLGEFGFTFQELAGAGALQHMTGELIGRDPFDTEAIWQILLRRDFFPGGKAAMGAISAIDLALWDLKGKALGQPIWRLLGGKVRGRVPAYFAVGTSTIDAMIEASVQRVREGWRYLRFGLPDQGGMFSAAAAVRAGVDTFAAVRAAVGADVELIIDAHTRLDPPEATRFCRQLEPYDPFFVEDPLRSENPESYRQLRNRTAVPLAAGEQFAGKWEFRVLIEEELTDYARIDLCNVGGFTEARKIAGWAETHHIKVVPHNPLSPVSSAACLHLAVTTDNFAVQEAGRTHSGFMRDVFPVQPDFATGNWSVPTAPGLGVEIDETVLAKFPFVDGSCPRLVKPDGSFTNW